MGRPSRDEMAHETICTQKHCSCFNDNTPTFKKISYILGSPVKNTSGENTVFERGISKDTKSCLELLGKQPFVAPFYLAGGTALALHLGHRLSYDLDFFRTDDFDSALFAGQLQNSGKLMIDQKSEFTFNGRLNGVKVSFFRYPYPLFKPLVNYGTVKLAAIEDIACMKLDAISSRGAKRDFIDLFFICRYGYDLQQLFFDFDKKYKKTSYNRGHLLKSLTYYADAEDDPLPEMHKKTDWEKVKVFFAKQVTKLI